jgi:cytochrome c553
MVRDDGKPKRLPDSSERFTVAQLRDLFSAPDWHPEAHPPMPAVVGYGRKPDVLACGYCHLPTGNGRPENANIAGLSPEYIIEQVGDFKTGARSSALPERVPFAYMRMEALSLGKADLTAAARYFTHLRPKSFLRVVEAATVPKTYISGWILAKVRGTATEPIGERIVEVPDNLDQFELRDDRTSYTAYVPPGSIGQGKTLVLTGGEKTLPCTSCHGPDLKGVGTAPPIVGRSPSYIARQLFDFKSGARGGTHNALMKPVVATLNGPDMIAIAAYLASNGP